MSAAQWSEGYATGAGYMHGYYNDLNPRRAAFTMLLEGLEGPPAGPACELGFGQGVSIAMHAAAQPERRWWGTDFMPEHAAHARRLVDSAGADAVISDQSFEEFAAREDLPLFAFVALHGIWSWVSADNRARIVDFLRRHLLPGGVVYVSWDVLAGFGALLPLRDLMRRHYVAAGSAKPELQRAHEALAFVRRLTDTGCATADATPGLKSLLADLADKPPEFVLHDLLNADWHPQSFADVADALAGAKLGFAASSDLRDRVAGIHTSPAQEALLATIEPPPLRAAAREVMLGTRFSRGYWVRGAQRLARAEAVRRLEAQRLVLARVPSEVPTRLSGSHAARVLDPAMLQPLLERCERAVAPVELGVLLADARARGQDRNAVVEMVAALVGMGALQPAPDDATAAAARPATRRLNDGLLAPAGRRGRIDEMASPLTGGGVPVSVSQQQLLAARAAAPADPASWPGRVWDAMQAEGQQMVRAGAPVTDRATALAMLAPLVPHLQERMLPLLRRLQVVD